MSYGRDLGMEMPDGVEEAQRILGTGGATEAIHRALQEVVNHAKRRRLLDMGVGDLTPQRLEEMRQSLEPDLFMDVGCKVPLWLGLA